VVGFIHTAFTSIFTVEMPLDNLSHFDEKSGVVSFNTEWGHWWQTVHEVHIEVNLPKNTKAKDVSVKVCPNEINCIISKETVFKVQLVNFYFLYSFIFFFKNCLIFTSIFPNFYFRVVYTVQCILMKQFGL